MAKTKKENGKKPAKTEIVSDSLDENNYDKTTLESEGAPTDGPAEEKSSILSKIGNFFKITGKGIWTGIKYTGIGIGKAAKWIAVGKGDGGIWKGMKWMWGAIKWMAVGKGDGGIWRGLREIGKWLRDPSHTKDITMTGLFVVGGVTALIFPPVGIIILSLGLALLIIKAVGMMIDVWNFDPNEIDVEILDPEPA